MPTLPPLANLLAIRDEIPDHIADCDRDDDPHSLAAITGHLTTSGDFDHIFHPAPHWVCAQKYLPDSVPDPAEAKSNPGTSATPAPASNPWPPGCKKVCVPF